MSLSLLPVECSIKMLSFLDKNSLYNWLFVNRYYCKLTIPIIWKEPFNITCSDKNYLIINTLLACLNEEEISSLVPCEMDFAGSIQSPLFEYGKFIRSIDHEDLVESIFDWFDSFSEIVPVTDCKVQGIVDAIYHIIMRQGSNLKDFSFEVSSQEYYFDLPKTSTFMVYKPGITNLRSLIVDIDLGHNYNMNYQNVIEFLGMVSTECNSITNCKWWINEVDGVFINPLFDIVKSQPLERMTAYLHEKNGEIFFHSLIYRIETLKELLLNNFDFQRLDLSFLSRFERLENLEFVDCAGFTLQHYLSLCKNKLNLKIVRLWNSECYINNIKSDPLDIKLDALEKMVNYLCSEMLIKLSLNVVTPKIILAVRESCPNISFLHIKLFSDKYLDSIIPTVCELSSLKTLKIEIGFEDNGENVNLLVKILGDKLAFVEYLSLNFYIDLSIFKYFTYNCQANLRKWKIIGNSKDQQNQRKCYLECVDSFQKVHNSLKLLGIIRDNEGGFCWTNEELVIVGSLNNQGVEIVPSNQLNMLFY